MMWPFHCSKCKDFDEIKKMRDHWFWQWREVNEDFENVRKLQILQWRPLAETPPLNTNLLVANKDFTYFGFLYLEEGWDYSRQINMQSKRTIWATYTNTESISWWLNLDEIKK